MKSHRYYIFRLLSALSVAVFMLFGASARADQSARFGLWVEVEGVNQPFANRKNIETLKQLIREGKFTDIYCQVYRNGKSWFPSSLADDRPFKQAQEQGLDPLGELISEARAHGQRVHAWLNVLRVESRDAAVFRSVGVNAALRDRFGNSLLDYSPEGRPPGTLGQYFKLDTPGIWLDPSDHQLRSYVLGVVRELLSVYPELAGVHLDMIRYPFAQSTGLYSAKYSELDFGYADSSIRRFHVSENTAVLPMLTGDAPAADFQTRFYPPTRLPSGTTWDNWRRRQITLLVFQIRELLNEVSADKELSAAVLASVERSRDSALQEWGEWLRGGLIRPAIPMAYTAELSYLEELSRRAVQLAGTEEVAIGLGGWLLLGEPITMAKQVELSMKSGASGVVLFSYSNLLSPRGRDLIRAARNAFEKYRYQR